MDLKRIEALLRGISLILVGLVFSISLINFPYSAFGLPFALVGWWMVNKDHIQKK